jgi:hypothetical protein
MRLISAPLRATDPNDGPDEIDPITAAVERLFALSDERTFMSDPS